LSPERAAAIARGESVFHATRVRWKKHSASGSAAWQPCDVGATFLVQHTQMQLRKYCRTAPAPPPSRRECSKHAHAFCHCAPNTATGPRFALEYVSVAALASHADLPPSWAKMPFFDEGFDPDAGFAVCTTAS